MNTRQVAWCVALLSGLILVCRAQAQENSVTSSNKSCVVPALPPFSQSLVHSVVGQGTPESCNERALGRAVAGGGTITFNCGGPATIPISSQIKLRMDMDTAIDGGGQIVLDAHGHSRIFYADGGSYRVNTHTFRIENIKLQNAKSSPDHPLPVPDVANPKPGVYCSTGYGLADGGGAIFLQDFNLIVSNVVFENNHTPSIGPDLAGGAIYVNGALHALIIASTFEGNSASNGGAIGSLNSDLQVFNARFLHNRAEGWGANMAGGVSECKIGTMGANGCPCLESGQFQEGSGGNAGAIQMDGTEDGPSTICGSSFIDNHAGTRGSLAGAIFRTNFLPEDRVNNMKAATIDSCTFDSNTAPQGGALFYDASRLAIRNSTFINNKAFVNDGQGAGVGGAVMTSRCILTIENSTFSHNSAQLWGTLLNGDLQTHIRHCTFSNNIAKRYPVLYSGDDSPDSVLPQTTIEHSIFSGNQSSDGLPPTQCVNRGVAVAFDGEGNLEWPNPGTSPPNESSGCAKNVMFGDPALGTTAGAVEVPRAAGQ